MNAFTFPPTDTVPSEVQALLEGPRQHLGFVPNLLTGLGHAPAALGAYLDLSKHFAKTGLTGVEMQTVLIVTSVENACAYCVAAHSTFATAMKIDPAVLAGLRQGDSVPDRRLDALAGFVRVLVRRKGHVTDAELQRFLDAGFTREQGLGILVGVAMKTIANLGNHYMHTPLDAQFAAQRWSN